MMRFLFIFLFCLITSQAAQATTWNEPWQDEVIRLSDSFIKVEITENKGSQATADVVKLLAGSETPKTIVLKNYSALQLISLSDKGELGLPFKIGGSYYLFVKKDVKGQFYQIPTPTSGWARIEGKNVYATYRHSYHQALVPEEIYEKTMQAVFNGIKGKSYDENFITGFINEQLSQKVGTLDDDNPENNNRFFLQHAALETFYYLGKGTDIRILMPFINTNSAHVQISACRAVSKLNTAESKEILMKFIEGNGNGFAKIMSVRGLKQLNAKEMLNRLKVFLKTGTDEETGFGGSIMDPRVGTFFPASVKESVQSLVNEWEPSGNRKST